MAYSVNSRFYSFFVFISDIILVILEYSYFLDRSIHLFIAS